LGHNRVLPSTYPNLSAALLVSLEVPIRYISQIDSKQNPRLEFNDSGPPGLALLRI
jgi:hypothetical protein